LKRYRIRRGARSKRRTRKVKRTKKEPSKTLIKGAKKSMSEGLNSNATYA